MSRLAQLEKLRAVDPNDADVAYMIAQEHAKLGDVPAAVHWYDACLALSPSYHYAYFHKAKALESAGETDRAREALTAGLARAKTDGNAQAINEISAYLFEIQA